MAGIRHAPADSTTASLAGQKRAHAHDTSPSHTSPKKRKVVHRLHHQQPISHIVEPINPEAASSGHSKDFFAQQLKRAIAIELKGQGFDSARPEAMERMHGLVDSYMLSFLARVRQSMSSARRTTTLPHDWIYALTSHSLTSSAVLEPLFDTGPLPPSILQPSFSPPEPAEPPPPDLENLIGPELSGKTEKERRKWIPKHFPPFPSQHTWKSTPVFTTRESDPAKIRERATEEGIQAEMSLRKLMAAHKQGVQKKTKERRGEKGGVRGTASKRERLWRDAMESLVMEEEKREHLDRELDRDADGDHEDDADADADADAEGDVEGDWIDPTAGIHRPRDRRPDKEKTTKKTDVNLDEGVHANYDQRFWRKAAREGLS